MYEYVYMFVHISKGIAHRPYHVRLIQSAVAN